MRLFRVKTGYEDEVYMPKWCTFLLGIVVGGFFHEFLMPFLWGILAVAVILGIRAAYVHFEDPYPPHDMMFGA